MKVGKIENHGGVVNFGDIYGDVSTGIYSAHDGVNNDNDELKNLRDELLNLADTINNNATEVVNPEQTLKRVGKLSEEAFLADADKTLLERYLELIDSATDKIPSVMKIIGNIKSIFAGFA